ncbi:MAG: hypothetical protein ABUK01_00920 [Leptospirales bacterium]
MKIKNSIYYLLALFFAVTPAWATEEAQLAPVSDILILMVLIVFSIPLTVYTFGHYILKTQGTLIYTLSGAIIGFVVGAMVDVIAAKEYVQTINIYIIGLGAFALVGSITANVMSHRSHS